MANSTRKPAKPAKPYPEFPLYAHNSGWWAKKIRCRVHYFGRWDDWEGALAKYQHDVHYIMRGVAPPPMDDAPADVLTVRRLVDRMLAHQKTKLETGEITARTYNDSKRTGDRLVELLGGATAVESLIPEDFAKLRDELARGRGLVSLKNDITRMRAFFIFAYQQQLIERPVNFGVSFATPSKKSLKRESKRRPKKLFSVEELRILLAAADTNMRAFILLALNSGMGNGDIGRLEFRHLTDDGWIDYPRPKTEEDRSFPLWPETKAAIEKAKNDRGRLPFVFVTKYGQCWFKDGQADSPISKEFRKLLDATGLYQENRGFYSLRHTFRTVADGCKDQVAVNYIMGHADQSMAAIYREEIEPERLQAVVDHVRAKLAPALEQLP